MSVITVFSGTYCNDGPVVQALRRNTHCRLVADSDLVAEAARLASMPESKIERAFSARISSFNKITHERERSIAYLRLALSRMQDADNVIFSGFAGQLIPQTLRHVLRVGLIADMRHRIVAAMETLQVSEQEATKLIRRQDNDRTAWIHGISGGSDPWDAPWHDMVFRTDKMPVKTIVDTVTGFSGSHASRPAPRAQQAVEDFRLSARVEVALIGEGHHVDVVSKDGAVTLTINKHVLMLSHLENELKAIAGNVPGVKSVVTRVGTGFHAADDYQRQDFSMPSKLLLVDEEREYIQTLSERLLMRDMGSVVTYDGESALELVREDEPDVMILSLMSPGIDGIEVLQRVKALQPDIEVILLTGPDSDADVRNCIKSGAFACLQKPVDLDELCAAITRANEQIHQYRSSSGIQSLAETAPGGPHGTDHS